LLDLNAEILPGAPFHWREVVYTCCRGPHRGQRYAPDEEAQAAIRRCVEIFAWPMRQACGLPIFIVGGGGYDPLRDPETGIYVSHRGSAQKPSTTQHHHGGALDLRIGSSRRGRAYAPPWGLDRAHVFLEEQARKAGIGAGIGIYRTDNFLHADVRPKRGRWRG